MRAKRHTGFKMLPKGRAGQCHANAPGTEAQRCRDGERRAPEPKGSNPRGTPAVVCAGDKARETPKA